MMLKPLDLHRLGIEQAKCNMNFLNYAPSEHLRAILLKLATGTMPFRKICRILDPPNLNRQRLHS